MKTSIRNWLVVLTTILLTSATAFAANFTKGNLAVLRVGDGTTVLGTGSAPISIIEFTPAGVPVQTNSIPSSGVTALTAAGSSTSEGFITSSPDGKTLVLVGYNLNAGTATVSSTTAALGKRSIATLSPSGAFAIQYTSAATFAGNIRSGATDGSGNFWAACSSGGIAYMNNNTQVVSANTRVVNVFNGNLYYDVQTVFNGFTGLPTTTTVPTALVSAQSSLYDSAINPAGTILYLADDGATTGSGGVRRFDWNGSAWVFSYAMKPNAATTTGASAITVDWSGANPVIYGSSGGNALFVLTDTGIGSQGTAIATPGANYAFRGVRFAPSGAPVITSQPAGQTVTEGGNANYSVTLAAGTSTTSLTYVWKDNLGATLATHSTASLSDSFIFTSAQLADNNKQIHVEISNDLGNVVSAAADLIVNAAGQPPTINFDITPSQDPIYAGQTVNFQVDVFGTTPMTYSWFLNGSPLSSGGNVSISSVGLSSVVTFTGITALQQGTLYCGITNSFGGTSSTLAYSVTTPAVPAVTAMNPTGNITNNAGTSRSVTVTASDESGVLTYQWQKGGANLSNGTHPNAATVAGATTSSLNLTGLLAADAGTYHCLVSNAGGTTDSSSASFSVNLTVNEPVILTHPKGGILRQSGSTTLSVVAGGTGLSYQWKKDGNNIAGATDTAYPIPSASSADTGNYTVNVHSAGTGGDLLSSVAQVIVASTTPVAIASTNLVILQLGDGVESASANGNSIFVMQYTKTGSLVSTYAVDNSSADALVITGNSTSEGHLSRANDGKSLSFGAYNTPPAGSSVILSTSIPRAVVTIDSTGAVTIANRQSFYAGGNMRSVASDGLGNYWGAGNVQGTIYMGTNGPTNTLQTATANTRVVTVQNGQLYVGFPGATGGIYAIGTGTPTTGAQTMTRVLTNTVGSPYDYVFNPAGTICYVADDTSAVSQLERWDLVAGNWTNSYSFAQGCRSLAVDWSGADPVVYGTSTDNKLFSVTDTGSGSVVTTLATAPGGLFRGVKFGPAPPKTSQTITFGAIADQYSCAAPVALGATASSSLPVTYTVTAGPATISGGNVVITTPVASATVVTVRADQVGDATYDAAPSVSQSFTVNPSSPVFNITGSNPATVECHGSYSDAGATATDSCGNSLVVTPSGSVNADTVNAYTITYSATDSSSGVTSTATRVVNVTDTVAPVITVTGPLSIDVCQGSTYTDAGATAQDDCTGAVTPTPTGSVDTSTLGNYTITYTATDSNNNSSTATRVVHVVDCSINIVTQPQSQLKVPQGTQVTLSVVATGPNLRYQWLEHGQEMLNETNSSLTFAAQPSAVFTPSTNRTFSVLVTNEVFTAPSDTASVTIVIDKATPTFAMTAPAQNARAQSFTLSGSAKEANGNAAKLIYFWTGQTVPGTSQLYTNDLTTSPYVSGTPASRTITAMPINNPPHGGTNILEAWVESLSGKSSAPHQKKTVFWQVPHTYDLTIAGDGSGTVSVTTKPAGTVVGAPPAAPTTLLGQANTTYHLQLYAYQTYAIKFTPDANDGKPTPEKIGSVVSNTVPGLSTVKAQTIAFTAADAADSKTVFFNRNHVKEMAGSYSGVFSETGNPAIRSAGLLSLNVMANGKFVAKVLNPGQSASIVPTTLHGDIQQDGTLGTNDTSYTLSGKLDWANSATDGGIKQFIGTVSHTAGWSSDVIADRFEHGKLAPGSKRTMVIPSFAGGPTGDSYATITDSLNARTFNFSLADSELPIAGSSGAINANAAGNFGIFVYEKYKPTDSASHAVLFGTWNTNAGNQVTLHWVKQSGGQLVPAGFTNAPVATVAPHVSGLTGQHVVGITNGALQLSYTMTFSGTPGVKATKDSGPTNSIVVVQTPTGTINVTFANGHPTAPKTTVGHAASLDDAQTAGGFFLPNPTGSTDSGLIRIQ